MSPSLIIFATLRSIASRAKGMCSNLSGSGPPVQFLSLILSTDMNNCSEFWDLFDLENCKRGTFLFFPRLIRPDLPWDKFGIFGNFGSRALTWLFLSSGRLH